MQAVRERNKQAQAARRVAKGSVTGARGLLAVRIRLLREALATFDRDPTAFRGWLVAKIAECQEKIDGKKSIVEHLQAAE